MLEECRCGLKLTEQCMRSGAEMDFSRPDIGEDRSLPAWTFGLPWC